MKELLMQIDKDYLEVATMVMTLAIDVLMYLMFLKLMSRHMETGLSPVLQKSWRGFAILATVSFPFVWLAVYILLSTILCLSIVLFRAFC